MNKPAWDRRRPVDHLLERLDGVQKTGPDRWMACCPVHDDRQQSLSVSENKDGDALLKCHAGCSSGEVVSELGLRWTELFAGSPSRALEKSIVATYDYTDECGDLLFQVVRFEPKDFRQRKPNGLGGWDWHLDGIRVVPYRLQNVVLAVKEGKPIAIVEGEKDVHAVEAAGYTATCNPGGAGKWRDSYTKYLEGATVGVFADRDQPGRKHAFEVAKSLRGIAKTVKVLEPSEHKDMAAHLAAGGLFAQPDLLPAKCPCCERRVV